MFKSPFLPTAKLIRQIPAFYPYPMQLVSRKSEVRIYLAACISTYQRQGLWACVQETEKQLLNKKVKFPLLEFCGHEFFREIASEEHIAFCDQIEKLKTEGGNVILGIMLQNRLGAHFDESVNKAAEYISRADIWYVCDIIGERVFGYSLLHTPQKTLPELIRLSKNENNWVVRSLGAGMHYAIKKGLDKEHVRTVFQLLLSLATSRDKEIRQGIGWAAKTTAKFHPEIIAQFQEDIQHETIASSWFRTKIRIGLNRNQYAKGN